MEMQMLHVFRNTPHGRETLLQTAYFCKSAGISPVVYIPGHLKFLMYFDNDVVQVDLNPSYLRSPATARDHAADVFADLGLPPPKFIVPKHFTASALPDIPVDFDFMTCPHSISDLSARIGPGYVGPRVRRILQSARFPVLIPSAVYKPFNRIAVLFGDPANAVRAFRLGVRLGRLMEMPVTLFTRENRHGKTDYEGLLAKKGLSVDLEQSVTEWHVLPDHDFEDNLYRVPHDALVVLGAAGHGLIRSLLFGSIMEKIQTVLPNSLLIVGQNYRSV